MLLEHGADIDATTRMGETALGQLLISNQLVEHMKQSKYSGSWICEFAFALLTHR